MEMVRLYQGRTPVRTSGRDQVSASSHPGTGSPGRTEREAQLVSPEANCIRTVLSTQPPPRLRCGTRRIVNVETPPWAALQSFK